MKSRRILFSTIIIIVFSVIKSYGQQADSTKRKSVSYLSQYLKTDTATARQVNEVQEAYKKSASQVMANAALSEQQKRAAIDNLIDEKNRKLEQLLPPLERGKIIPTTERRKNWKADSTARTTN
ncbi:MAG: hypothetical protein V4456_16530 [Bacteroidota bacterium]